VCNKRVHTIEQEQNPPQSVSGIIPWGVTTQLAADALTSVFAGRNSATLALMKAIDREIAQRIERNHDGIEPCGYEEL